MTQRRINYEIGPAQLGVAEHNLARLTTSEIDAMFADMARQLAIFMRFESGRRNIRRTGAFIGGWTSRKVAPKKHDMFNRVPYAIFLETGRKYGPVLFSPRVESALARMVHDATEKHMDAAFERAYRR